MKYVVWAGGSGQRFVNHELGCKHQIQVDGETLLERIVRQVRPTADEIWILGCAPDHACPDTHLYVTSDSEKKNHRLWKWFKGLEIANGSDVVFMQADVFYSDDAIQKITQNRSPIQFFLRPGPSEYTGKKFKELFAIRVAAEAQMRVRELISKALDIEDSVWRRSWQSLGVCLSSQNRSSATQSGGFWILRELADISWYSSLFRWSKIVGNTYMDSFFKRAERYVTIIDDWTEDFDTWNEFVAWSYSRSLHEPLRSS